MPMRLEYLVGDATVPLDKDLTVICHIVNCHGVWGGGFTGALNRAFPKVREEYLELVRSVPPNAQLDLLGKAQFVDFVPDRYDVAVVNLFGQTMGYLGGIPPVRYDGVYQAMTRMVRKLEVWQRTPLVQMPRIGQGLAGGDWTIILAIINSVFSDSDVLFDVAIIQRQQGIDAENERQQEV